MKILFIDNNVIIYKTTCMNNPYLGNMQLHSPVVDYLQFEL